MIPRLLKILFVLPVDLVLALALGLFDLAYWLVAVRGRSRAHLPSALAQISCGGTVELILRKFGTMDYLFRYDGDATEGVFDRNLLYWFPSHGNNLRMEIKDWVIVERRMKLFLFTCLAYFFLTALREAKKLNVTLVRATDPYLVGLWGFLLSRMYECPFLISIHSNYDKRWELDGPRGVPLVFGCWPLTRMVERFVLSRADMTTTYFQDRAAWLERHGVPRERIAVIPPHVHLAPARAGAQTDFRERFGLPRDKKLLSFAGRFSKENYILDVLALAERLADREDWLLVLAGGGTYELDMDELLQQRPALRDRTRFLGRLAHQDVWEMRYASDIALCLMGGFSLIEACAAGCATVAYDVEWHGELIEDGVTGALLPEHDLDALEGRVRALLDSENKRRPLGQAAKVRAQSLYAEEIADGKRRQLYKTMTERGAKG